MNRLKVKNREMQEENRAMEDRIRRLEHLIRLHNAENQRLKEELRAELMTQNAILKKAGKEITVTLDEIKTAPEYIVRPDKDGQIVSFTFVLPDSSVKITEETE